MIQVENLTRYYDDFCAVNGISLNISRGEILGLLGPNGAGKTTTLRMLTGYLRPTSGSIRVKGLSVDNDMLEIKRLLGYLPESAPLYPDMLVYDYLFYVAGLRGIDSSARLSRIRDMADMCAVNEVMHQPVAELSKGYKQRVGLAHALINDPEVLVLDEPTSGLDPNQIAEIRDIIRRIGKEKTIIFSTHILSEAEATCDRIAITDKGKIVADESCGALKQKAAQDYHIHLTLTGAVGQEVKNLLAEVSGVLEIAEAPEPETGARGEEVRLRLRCPAAADPRREIYARIRQTDWNLLEFFSETPSLENIFRKLTRES